MLFHTLTAATLVATAIAAPRTLSSCSETSDQPCRCPEGTDYMTATTYLTVGANAFDVRELLGDFYNLDWVPQKVVDPTGPDNKVGSTRLTVIAIDVGMYEWLEELTRYELGPDGSFLWAFKVANVPLKFHEVPGRFAGEFISMKTDVISSNQTQISWNLYGCHSGGMHRYSEFQRMVLTRVNGLLEEAGKITGDSETAWSEIGVPRGMTLASAVDFPTNAGSQRPLTDGGVSRKQHLGNGNAWTAL
ncbi:hypothetical protein HYFRA_00013228 [Hymenoscyphus fraxineus]|uniref:Uncharacterized protein n=1 Tax=Hymenoscyphus fraxineus TaxID=746836 RepID=A0A9N9L4A8_9HELO|nr:hypothetical protein HYFRA_00013228 [Hymenoscyphus fraxineus]